MSLQQGTFFAGIRWTGLASLLSFGLGVLQVVVLARYLEKSDFAWIALAGVFVNIGIQIQQAGLNTALLQPAVLTQRQLSTVYWCNLALGAGLYLLAVVGAFLLRWLYQSPLLLPIMLAYAAVLLLQAIFVQYKALLQKNFDFSHLSIGESLGAVAGFAVSVTAALAGWGAFALVSGYVARYLIEGMYVLWVGKSLFTPSLQWHWQSIQPLVQFGGWHWSERLVTHFSAQMDVLLIGKLLGSEALGTYEVFKRVLVRPLNLLNDIFEKVTLPLFAHLQHDIAAQRKLYLDLLTNLAAINFPILIFMIMSATPLVELVFGARWLSGVSIFQGLCAFCLWHFLLNPVDTLLVAANKIRLWLLANVGFIPLQILFLTIASPFGLFAVTGAMVAAAGIFTMLTYRLIVLPHLQIRTWELLSSLSRPCCLTLLAVSVLLPFQGWSASLWLLLLLVGLFSGTYGLLTFFYNRGFVNLLFNFFNK